MYAEVGEPLTQDSHNLARYTQLMPGFSFCNFVPENLQNKYSYHMLRAYSVQDAELTTYHESIFDPHNNLKKKRALAYHLDS